ncbi:hypothetical protein Poli38472_001579 [Pythium oligandrum]|uniref:Chitosanase n=1 Tax=Pythium oligandrum TaxID=41045 RepID=A0A8K1CUY4_PYTOL|nr:hypothetical protein Poli38472_001579 [Pythium oligandrum]|eukprot:TMW69423.1 hypothetical protein Poli38472_001579 [Pythium oligandrum]
MSLVSIPENSKIEWWTNYDYCEDINGDRGFTVSLVGFCSGTSDLLRVVRDVATAKPSHPIAQFVKPLEAVDGTPSHMGLGSLCSTIHSNNDDTWKNAVWNGIRREYWDPAAEWAAKHGLTSALSKGFLFDVALNHGSEVIDELAKKTGKNPKTVGEKAFMMEFMKARAAVITSGDDTTNNGQTDRVDLWKSILQKENMQLKRPLKDLKCYGDTFEITG